MGSILNWYGSAFCWHGNAWDRCTIHASLGLLAECSSLVSIPNTRLLTWFGSTWVEFYMMEIFEKSFCTVVKWKFLNLIPLEFLKYIDSPQRRLKKTQWFVEVFAGNATAWNGIDPISCKQHGSDPKWCGWKTRQIQHVSMVKRREVIFLQFSVFFVW